MNAVRRPSAPIFSSGDGGHAHALSHRSFSMGNDLSLHHPYRSLMPVHTGNLSCPQAPNSALGPLCTIAPGLGVSRNHGAYCDSIDGHQGVGHNGGGRNGRSGLFTGQADNTPHGDSDIIELHYQGLLQSDPQNPLFLQNYAQFLLRVKHDLLRAEEYYERTILACPDDGRVLATYAELLWDAHRDSDRASMYFEQAVMASPDDCNVLASYASFVWQLESQDNLVVSLTPI
ncbi:hypothetical protein GOP47_0021147 [Adiantum capillus-veneris]|uniref:Uncharacterized protein n=1 Tax=Adiantum capillus-veneris TaxID=13818 RepID=A0A9D4Z8E2_ADICA|nr:hypothetical protein GOP47_0021147 [Adiantum capillus-veneris]